MTVHHLCADHEKALRSALGDHLDTLAAIGPVSLPSPNVVCCSNAHLHQTPPPPADATALLSPAALSRGDVRTILFAPPSRVDAAPPVDRETSRGVDDGTYPNLEEELAKLDERAADSPDWDPDFKEAIDAGAVALPGQAGVMGRQTFEALKSAISKREADAPELSLGDVAGLLADRIAPAEYVAPNQVDRGNYGLPYRVCGDCCGVLMNRADAIRDPTVHEITLGAPCEMHAILFPSHKLMPSSTSVVCLPRHTDLAELAKLAKGRTEATAARAADLSATRILETTAARVADLEAAIAHTPSLPAWASTRFGGNANGFGPLTELTARIFVAWSGSSRQDDATLDMAHLYAQKILALTKGE